MIVTVDMTATVKGSPDGINVREYRSGNRYDIPDDLARVFIHELQCAVSKKSVETIQLADLTPKPKRTKRQVK